MTDVTLIGLGPMGLAMADLLLGAGTTMTVWNRSAAKAAPLVERGAALASTPAAAIAASPTTLICLYDYAAVEAVLAAEGAPDALAGRLIVNLGTGGPEEARRMEAWMRGHGARYLDGAIQAAPSQMGRPDTPLLMSGMRDDVAQVEPMLRLLAGHLVHLGENIDGAAFMDLATLSYVYGSFAGFLHGARIAESTGIDVATYGELVDAIAPSFGAFFAHEGRVIASGDFRITESPLRISIPAVRRILAASRELGLNTEMPVLMDGWLRRAESAGMADEELAALIKVLRVAPGGDTGLAPRRALRADVADETAR
jgi:3-hydroxyisobutyrate dehydrogenase-like beta-hydroxyacid dehydrogenase